MNWLYLVKSIFLGSTQEKVRLNSTARITDQHFIWEEEPKFKSSKYIESYLIEQSISSPSKR